VEPQEGNGPGTLLGPEGVAVAHAPYTRRATGPRRVPVAFGCARTGLAPYGAPLSGAYAGSPGRCRPYLENCTVDASIF